MIGVGSARIGRSQSRGALLGVPRRELMLRGRADRDGVDRAGVAITIAVVATSTAVTRRPHIDNALAAAALGDALDKGLAGQGARALQGATVIIGTPRGRVHVNVLVLEGDSLRLGSVGDAAVQHAHAAYFGVERDAHAAEAVVGDHGDLAGAARAVLVLVGLVVARRGIVVAVVQVRAGLRVVVAQDVLVLPLEAVVQDGHHDALAREAHRPGRNDVKVEFVARSGRFARRLSSISLLSNKKKGIFRASKLD